MILGFKDRFVPFVEDGSKTHTIRAGDRWRVGMRADLYARPRQKGMRLLFRAIVSAVQEIEILPALSDRIPTGKLIVVIDGQALAKDEVEGFFRRDGFRGGSSTSSQEQAFYFWKDSFPFKGQIIHWDYGKKELGGIRCSDQMEG